jgi:hypothetical protein
MAPISGLPTRVAIRQSAGRYGLRGARWMGPVVVGLPPSGRRAAGFGGRYNHLRGLTGAIGWVPLMAPQAAQRGRLSSAELQVRLDPPVSPPE